MPDTDLADEETLPEFEPIEPPRGRWVLVKLGLPVLGVLAGITALLVTLEPGVRRNVFVFLGAYLVPGGIDAAPPLGVSLLDLEPIWIVGLIHYFDLWLTAFWVWNLDHLARFDVIDRRVEKSRQRAHQLWERFPWLRVASAPGLALFILIPIPTTGSFTGIAIGKLIELPDLAIYVASIVGTLVRISLLAFGADAIFTSLA